MPIDFKAAREESDAMVATARTRAMAAKAASPAILTSRPSASGDGTAHLDTSAPREQYGGFRDWVYAGVHRVAARIAGQAVCVARERTSGPTGTKAAEDRWEPIERHPLLDRVESPGEPHGSGWNLKYSTAASMLLTGASRWHVADDGIIAIPLTWFEKRTTSHWHVRRPEASQVTRLPVDEVVSFSLPDPANPFAVASPLARLGRAATADDKILESQISSFDRSIRPSVALHVGKMPGMPGVNQAGVRPTLTLEQRHQLVDAVKKFYSGAAKHGEPFVIDGMIEKVSQIFTHPGEIDWLQSGQSVKERILLGLGVSEIILGSQEANKASAAAARGIFVDFSVNPLSRNLSETMTAQLGPMFASENERLRVYLEPATARDDETRIASYNGAAKAGCCTINEYRKAILNLPAIDGGDKLIKQAAPDPLADPAKAWGDVDPYTLQAW